MDKTPKYPLERVDYPTLHQTLERAKKRPFTGVTQGGSSRKDAGAKPAAIDANIPAYRRPTKQTGE